MPRIPLAPLQPSGDNGPNPDRKGEGGRSKRRLFHRVARAARYVASPFGAWAGARSIRSSASFIGETVRDVLVATRRDPRFRLFPNGDFDLEATAFLFGISVPVLTRRLAARRRQTALTAYFCLSLSIASTMTWLGYLFGSPAEAGSVMLIANAMGFGAICLLGAFYQALVNFQVRACRAAGWREFLLADRGFWPTP